MDSRVGGGASRQDAGGKLTSVVRAVDMMTPSGSDKGHGATSPTDWQVRRPHGKLTRQTMEDDGRDLAGLRRIPGEDGARDPGRHHRARLTHPQRGAAAGRRRRPRPIYLSSQTRAIADDP